MRLIEHKLTTMRRFLALAVFGLAITTQSFAQSMATVTGNVIDNTGRALASVTVSLLQGKDSSLVKAAVTEEDGQFEIASVKTGKLLLSFSSIGFEKKFSDLFELQAGQI